MRLPGFAFLAIAAYAAAALAVDGPPAPGAEAEAGGEPADAGAPEEAAASPPDPASTPPPAPGPREPSLDTRVSGRLRSEMFFSERPRMRRIGAGTYAVRPDRVFPFYETIDLRADELGLRGLSIQFQGWAGVDLADVYFDRRVVADPTYLFVEYRDHGLDLRLGRQLVYSGATRGLHLDGLFASYETPAHVGVEALGGLVVSPDLGPDWYRDAPAAASYEDYGAGLSDWDRHGDAAIGGRLFYRRAGRISAGVSILDVTELGEIDRRLFGVDLDAAPVAWLGVTGNAVLDLAVTRLQEANLAFDLFPSARLSIGADYRHADPTLYLSKMSIFSVFSVEEYDAVGGALRLRPREWLRLHAGYHHRFYSSIERRRAASGATTYGAAVDTGYEIAGGAVVTFGARRGGRLAADYVRLVEAERGVHELHGGIVVPLGVEGLRAVANGYLDFFDREWNAPYGRVDAVSGASPIKRWGYVADAGIFYGNGTVEAGAFGAHASTPYARQETRGMLKLSYNFDLRFVGRGQP